MKKTDPAVIANKYAKALFEMADEASKIESTLAELNALCEGLLKTEAREILITPQGSKVWAEFASAVSPHVSPLMANFVRLLSEMERGYLLPEIKTAYQAICDIHFDVARGVLVTAAQIDAEQMESMQAIVTKKIGKKVIFEHKHDPNILGGVVAKVGGWTFDDSLKSHLSKLTQKLVN